jgi:hypothetical protein
VAVFDNADGGGGNSAVGEDFLRDGGDLRGGVGGELLGGSVKRGGSEEGGGEEQAHDGKDSIWATTHITSYMSRTPSARSVSYGCNGARQDLKV